MHERPSGRELKNIVKQKVEQNDFSGIWELAQKDKRVYPALIGFTYDKKSALGERAIAFLGSILGKIAETQNDFARDMVRKLLWSANDESGAYGCSVPEILGETIRENPKAFADILPLVASLYEDEIFRPGVLQAIGRVGEKHKELVTEFLPLVQQALKSDKPEIIEQAKKTAFLLGI